MTGFEAAVDRLHAVPLEDFVAERTRLAKELRAAGERPAAADLAKLPKPTPPAWALNHVAREEAQATAAWLEAAAALREASLHAGEVGGDALRGAMGAHRTATTSLVSLVRERARPGGRPLSAPMLDRVRALLRAATVDPEQAERLRAGRVSEEAAAAPEPGSEPEPTAPEAERPAKAPAKRRAAKPRDAQAAGTRAEKERAATAERAAEKQRAAEEERAAKAERAAEERAAKERAAEKERRAERERALRAAEEEARRLRREATRRAQAARAAEERVEEARSALERAQAEAAIAHEAATEAEEAAAGAESGLGG